ncbi:MAG: YidC/Oxa1 family membrane protein insertase [Candidatus Nomurabacteria bacterium]|nr:YidC/Oxa1 family membrane protein insertase [Candidatus Nomurabacteria bacterium]
MQEFFQVALSDPLYNALVWLVDVLPGHSVGLAIIVLTIVVKLILSPFYYKSIKSQIEQQKIKPEIDKLKEKYPDKKEQAEKMMELYKEHGMSPLSGCLPIVLMLVIQLPILLALYRIFLGGFSFDDADRLYSFVKTPEIIRTAFLGLELTISSIWVALLAGASQFIQIYFSPTMNAPKKEGEKEGTGTGAMMQNMMQKQMKFVLPVMIFFFAWKLPAALGIYWITTNFYTIIQEILIRNRVARKNKSKQPHTPSLASKSSD